MRAYPYFDQQESIANIASGNEELVLTAVANRFIGSHPKLPPVYRTHTTNGFRRGSDYRYEMNLTEKWPELVDGQFVYVWGMLWADQEADSPFSISCYGPANVYVNDIKSFASNLNEDVFPERKSYFRAKLLKGWNHIILEFIKTGTGCGGKFGTGSVKGFPMHILAPTPERAGQEGWVYSEPQNERWTSLPGTAGEAPMPGSWYPDPEWLPEETDRGCFARIFGSRPGFTAFAWSRLEHLSPITSNVKLKGHYRGSCTVLLDGLPVYRSEGSAGELDIEIELTFGVHDLIVQSSCLGNEWGFELILELPSAPESGYSVTRLAKPAAVNGLQGHWLYLGPFEAGSIPEAVDVAHIHPVLEKGAAVCWRADQPDTWVRPYLENPMFGKWNYPLGVTLYGILKTGAALSDSHFTEYAADHIELCSSMNAYSIWDSERFGSPGINHQLTLIDSLDDCGSFGATMLEANKVRKLRGADTAAKRIAQFISEKQDRLPDGALYRVKGTTDFMKNTMWCDDLYMSTPFLAKYYELTGQTSYLDDAAEQFLLYKKRLFIPGLQIMHHVYDYKFDKPNGVPWGRGNGWVLFSLSELLAVMPSEHKRYDQLRAFFRELCEGYVKLQGDAGLWYQVLTDPESYGEASCTSMFMYAFARGVRFGWLEDTERYILSVFRGWKGLTNYCIDKSGNVYGVCRGSGYSYSSLYYKHELTWQLNDTHGIGIVLLAGIETLQLRKYLIGLR